MTKLDERPMTDYRSTWSRALLAAALAFATLWDFRVFDLRLFDGLALAAFAGSIVMGRRSADLSLSACRNYLPLLAIIVAYAGLGFALHQHRSSLAIMVICGVSFLAVGNRDWRWLAGPLKYLILAHAAAFTAQLLAFHLSGIVLDPHAVFGSGSRILQNGVDIRAAGLFQEANSYCANLFLLTSLAIILRIGRPVIFFAALTMMASNSLWGIAAAAILITACEFRGGNINRRRVLTYIGLIVFLAGAFNVFLWIAKPPSYPMPMLYWRISEIAHDPSLLARYVGENCGFKSAYDPNGRLISLGIGEGLTTKYFLECLPANGFAFLFMSFGIAGGLALLAGGGFAIRGLRIGNQIIIVASVIFLFTTYPLTTYFIFWLWLWTLLLAARADANPRIISGTLPE